jgi:hypothetical protein
MQTYRVAAIAIALVALAGCSSGHKTTVVTNGGTVTTDTSGDSKTTTITTQDASVKVGKNAVDPAKTGLPVYPGATTAEGGGWAMQSKNGGGEIVTLTTTDSFDAVEAWYKSKMPADSESLNMKTGDTASAVFTEGKEGDKEERSVMINGEKGKTTIMLSHSVKQGS